MAMNFQKQKMDAVKTLLAYDANDGFLLKDTTLDVVLSYIRKVDNISQMFGEEISSKIKGQDIARSSFTYQKSYKKFEIKDYDRRKTPSAITTDNKNKLHFTQQTVYISKDKSIDVEFDMREYEEANLEHVTEEYIVGMLDYINKIIEQNFFRYIIKNINLTTSAKKGDNKLKLRDGRAFTNIIPINFSSIKNATTIDERKMAGVKTIDQITTITDQIKHELKIEGYLENGIKDEWLFFHLSPQAIRLLFNTEYKRLLSPQSELQPLEMLKDTIDGLPVYVNRFLNKGDINIDNDDTGFIDSDLEDTTTKKIKWDNTDKAFYLDETNGARKRVMGIIGSKISAFQYLKSSNDLHVLNNLRKYRYKEIETVFRMVGDADKKPKGAHIVNKETYFLLVDDTNTLPAINDIPAKPKK